MKAKTVNCKRCYGWLLAMVFLLLNACSSLPPQPKLNSNQQNIAWLKHQSSLEKFDHWQFDGRFGIQSDIESWSGRLNWRQKNEHFNIHLSGPLGSGSLSLSGDKTHASLNQGKNKRFTAEDPELLLETYTNLRLPINSLRYWVTGQPSPSIDKHITLNEAGLLGHLSQKGWNISFKNYRKVDEKYLPGKIFLKNPTYDVRLIIKNWQTPLKQ